MRLLESMRRTIKHVICLAAYYSGLLYLFSFLRVSVLRKPVLVILTYHRILTVLSDENDKPQPGMVTLKETFEKQLKFLTKAYQVISLDELVGGLRENRLSARRYAAITLDDGWKDNFLHAFPLLKQYDVPATVFLTTDYIENEKMFWFHTVNSVVRNGSLTARELKVILDEQSAINPTLKTKLLSSIDRPDEFIELLKELEQVVLDEVVERINQAGKVDGERMMGKQWLLNWHEINEMRRHRISFGSHTCTHNILTRLESEQVAIELNKSKQLIEGNTGENVTAFAYPNGDFDRQIRAEVENAGYSCACTGSISQTAPDQIDLFALPRLGVHEGACLGVGGKFSRAIFACHVAGLFVCRQKKRAKA